MTIKLQSENGTKVLTSLVTSGYREGGLVYFGIQWEPIQRIGITRSFTVHECRWIYYLIV